jgi:ketosteroid isomerase-like protein
VNVLRQMDEAMTRQDFATFFAGYTDDVRIHIGGDNKLTGDDQGLAQLPALFGRFMEASGHYPFTNHAYLADDAHGVILQRGTMERDGTTLSTNEIFIYHFRDGKIAEFWDHPVNQAGVDAWWGK